MKQVMLADEVYTILANMAEVDGVSPAERIAALVRSLTEDRQANKRYEDEITFMKEALGSTDEEIAATEKLARQLYPAYWELAHDASVQE